MSHAHELEKSPAATQSTEPSEMTDSILDEVSKEPMASPSEESPMIRGPLSAQIHQQLSTPDTELTAQASPAPVSGEAFEAPPLDYEQIQQYAEKASNAQNRFDRVSFLGHLTWELIAQGEYAWAYQVSHCLFVNADEDLTIPAPPPWLIALLVMGENVRLSSGRVAREFESNANEHRREAEQIAGEPDSATAYLLRAALIRGAITTASVAASDILRCFSIEPMQTQLYNYCSRVASFASRSNGLKLDQYFYRPGAASLAADARTIRSRVKAWKRTVFDKILPYQIAPPLFSRAFWSVLSPVTVHNRDAIDFWRTRQILKAHIAKMLQPILDDEFQKTAIVESEIRRLSHSVLTSGENTQAIVSEQETVLVPGRELYNQVQEAIEFASHWLVVASMYPGIENVLVPQEINELRDEIDRRQNSVFRELKTIEKAHGHHQYKAALTACRRGMDRISQLFNPTEEPRIAELDPLCLLNAVLLKIPGVTLGDDWRCNISPVTLEHQILSVLKSGNISWKDAFEQQIKAGCYRAARSLLNIDVWSTDERKQLFGQLEEQRNNNIKSLTELTNQIKEKILQARKLDMMSTLESARLIQQVETIEERIPTEYQLDTLRNELNQLWQLMENRRNMEIQKIQQKMTRLQSLTEDEQTVSTHQEDSSVSPGQRDQNSPENDPKFPSDDPEEDDEDWAIDI